MTDMIMIKRTGDKMKAYKRIHRDKNKNQPLTKGLIGAITFVILFVLCSANIIPNKYNLKAGDIAPEDISSPRDIVDEAETQKKIQQETSGDITQYKTEEKIIEDALKDIKDFQELLDDTKASGSSSSEKVLAMKGNSLVTLDDDEANELLNQSSEETQKFIDFINKTVERILEQGIREGNEDDLKKAQSDLNYYIQNTSLSRISKEIANNIGINLIKPNMTVDDEKTEAYLEQLKKTIGVVIIKKDQNIVLKGEVITDEDFALMSSLGLLQQDGGKTDVKIYIGVGIIILLIELVLSFYLYKFKKDVFSDNSRLAIIALIICLSAGFTVGINIISPYLIPFALISILMVVIFDHDLAFAVSIPVFIITGLITNFNFEYTMIYVLSSIGGAIFIKDVHQRSSLLVDGICAGALNGVMVFAVGLISTDGMLQNLTNSAICFLGGILAAILAIGILPVIESIFDIITPVKLLELSNPNQPLLKKLLYEAPGTYHHSILVANLSEAAAEEIGANALLARVGAYYHDIGKIKRPYFFKENQIINDNPHDKITPKLSTVIITSHVRDGIDMAKEYKLPEAIRDIIQQHHGDTLVKYFYVMAKNDESEEVEDSSFRYDGPKPSTREAAIVMLADSTEAAVRSLTNPSVDEISKMVDRIVKDKIDDKQLDNCQITMQDIVKIRKSFKLVLEGIFHNRIEYPELKDGNEKENTDDRN
jgi:putative nucleotidyltransferase with HDIG domain